MNAYLYDDNGYYAGVGAAEPGDVPGSWFLPRNATLDETPEAPEGTVPRWNGTAWELADAADFEQARADAARREATETILTPRLLKTTAETAEMTDEELGAVGRGGFFDPWAAGQSYAAGKRLAHNGVVYECLVAVQAQEHQPPGGTMMYTVYRPVPMETGTMDNPKTLVDGVAPVVGECYKHNDGVWKNIRALDMVFAGRYPGDAGMESYWKESN